LTILILLSSFVFSVAAFQAHSNCLPQNLKSWKNSPAALKKQRFPSTIQSYSTSQSTQILNALPGGGAVSLDGRISFLLTTIVLLRALALLCAMAFTSAKKKIKAFHW
jgi:hypothetical protein